MSRGTSSTKQSRSQRPTERANGLAARHTSSAMARWHRTVTQQLLAFAPPTTKTVREAIERFRLEEMSDMRPSTRNWVDRYLRAIELEIGRRKVDGEFRAVVIHWRETFAPSAAEKMAYLLGRVLRMAVRRGMRTTEHDLEGLCSIRSRTREAILTLPQRVELFRYLRRPCASARRRIGLDCLHFLALSGWRPSEACMLERSWLGVDVTIDGDEFRFARLPRTKTTKGPQVRVICDDAAAFLDSLPDRGPYYFPHHYQTRTGPIGRASVWHAFRQIADELGWPKNLSPMVLRHTFSTVGAQLHLSPAFVAKLVGNTTETQQRSYQHPQSDDLVETAGSIGKAMLEGRKRRG